MISLCLQSIAFLGMKETLEKKKKKWTASNTASVQSFQNLSDLVPDGNYMFKVNNRSIRTRCEICSELTIKTPERRYWHHWRHVSHLVLVFTVKFEQVNAGWQYQLRLFLLAIEVRKTYFALEKQEQKYKPVEKNIFFITCIVLSFMNSGSVVVLLVTITT